MITVPGGAEMIFAIRAAARSTSGSQSLHAVIDLVRHSSKNSPRSSFACAGHAAERVRDEVHALLERRELLAVLEQAVGDGVGHAVAYHAAGAGRACLCRPAGARTGYDGRVVLRGGFGLAVAVAVAVVVVVPPAPARAAPRTLPPVEMVRDNLLVLAHAKTALDAALAGHCEVVLQIPPQLRALDPVFYELLFAVDPPIAACLTGRAVPRASWIPQRAPRERLVTDRREPPASGTRIAGELLLGALVGGGGALIGALIGAGACIGGGDTGDCTASLVGGAYLASVATVPLGVYAAGNSGRETGSLGMTYAGAALGGLGGLLLLANGEDTVTTIGLVLAPSIGAIIGFNMTRRYKPRRVAYGALLLFDDGRPSLGIPVVTRAAARDRTVTAVPLLGGTF